jgi:hypothetical protein
MKNILYKTILTLFIGLTALQSQAQDPLIGMRIDQITLPELLFP